MTAPAAKAYIPALVADRVVTQWHFEGGGFVAVISAGNRPTAELLDVIQELIERKRVELERIEARKTATIRGEKS
jgi:hypothetical protein